MANVPGKTKQPSQQNVQVPNKIKLLTENGRFIIIHPPLKKLITGGK